MIAAILLMLSDPSGVYEDGNAIVLVTPARRGWSIDRHWDVPGFNKTEHTALQHIGSVFYCERAGEIRQYYRIKPEPRKDKEIPTMRAFPRPEMLWVVIGGNVILDGAPLKRIGRAP